MVTIELDDQSAEVFERLVARAKANQVPLSHYLSVLANHADAKAKDVLSRPRPRKSAEEVQAILDRIAKVPPGTPSLPRDYSRDDMYDEETR